MDLSLDDLQQFLMSKKSVAKKVSDKNLKECFFMEIRDLKDVENWSISELDDAIVAIEKEIENSKANTKKLEADNKKLREVKSQKIFDELKPMLVETKIDLSDVLQHFLQSRNESNNKVEESKCSTTKKSADDSAEKKDSDFVNTSVENTGKIFEVTADEHLNKPADEFLEEATSKELKIITRYVKLPEDATFEEVRQSFDIQKNTLPPAYADYFEEILRKIERGEIA